MNVREFDLNLLRLLIAIDDTGSVSQAGEVLGLSQPASSNALARLRAALGDPLFIRSRNGMVPTALVAGMLPEVRLHLGALQGLLEGGGQFEPMRSRRVFNISLSGLGETVFLPRLATSVMRAAPHVRIANPAMPLIELGTALQRGTADLALGMFEVGGTGIRSLQLSEERYVAVAGPGMTQRPRSLDELRKHRLIVPAPASTFGGDVGEVLARNGLADNVVLRLGDFGALSELLRTLAVLAVVPREYARQLEAAGHAEDLGIVLAGRRTHINMVWHARSDADKGCVWLRELVEELFGQPRAAASPDYPGRLDT